MKKILTRKNILYGLYLFLSVLVLSEILLRIYNPFHFRIKGPNIVLETNKTYRVDNSVNPVLDKKITHTKNGLGFRGPEKPENFSRVLSIVTIGGSTTEGAFLNDGKTWTDALFRRLQTDFPEVWVNNAGLAGHSTFGHIALMKDHISNLRPKFALFLVGINDVRRDDLTDADKSKMANHYKTVFTFLSRKIELCNVIINILRTREAKKRNLYERFIDLKANRADSLVLDDASINIYLHNEGRWLLTYKNRLKTLISLCHEKNIRPVLITQPSLMGNGNDPVTGVSLENVKVNRNINGKLFWTQLEMYNEVTRQVAIENNILLVDLAHFMPKSSLYFYDMVHFTNEGSEKVGSILYDSLIDFLKENSSN